MSSFPVPAMSQVARVSEEEALFGADETAVATKRRGPTRDELLEGLNEPQRQAVTHEGAPLLVVAGAGSGKTRVLTRRIAWLISERNAHPGSILAITFTNKAAGELQARIDHLIRCRARILCVSTIHAPFGLSLRADHT